MPQMRWNTMTVDDGTEFGQVIRVLEYFDGTDWLAVPEIDTRPMPKATDLEQSKPRTAAARLPSFPA
jgi:hypothetical protein